MGESVLCSNKHAVQICRFLLSVDSLADGTGEHRTSHSDGDARSWNSIERSLSRAVVPQSLPVSATTFPTALSLYIAQGRLQKDIRYPNPLSKAVLKGRTVTIWNRKIHQVGLFFLLEACQRNVNGWSTASWPANAKLQLLHRHSSISRSCHRKCQAPCLYMLAWINLFNTVPSAFWHQRGHSSTWLESVSCK